MKLETLQTLNKNYVQGCYFNNHQDLQFEGLHDGFHTFGLRWKRDLLEWFVQTFFSSTRLYVTPLRYYDGQLVRTIDDPLQVSRGAGFFILSQGERIFFL